MQLVMFNLFTSPSPPFYVMPSGIASIQPNPQQQPGVLLTLVGVLDPVVIQGPVDYVAQLVNQALLLPPQVQGPIGPPGRTGATGPTGPTGP